MPRILTLIFICLFSIGLVACSNDQANEDNQSKTDIEEETESDIETKVKSEAIDDKNEEEKEEAKDQDNDESDHNKDIVDYEEASVIEDTIDITGMDVKVKTDNKNNRVLLFSENEEVMYKTVYVKKKQRLKIINIHEDKGQIFNEKINENVKKEAKNNDKSDHSKDIVDYEEASVIEDTIDITGMDVKVKTDNPNNRVLLFSENQEVMYKTVYVKKKQRLKIINIHEDKGQIFNEVI